MISLAVKEEVLRNIRYWETQFPQYGEKKVKISSFARDVIESILPGNGFHCRRPMKRAKVLGRELCDSRRHPATRFTVLHEFVFCACCGEIYDPPDYGEG